MLIQGNSKPKYLKIIMFLFFSLIFLLLLKNPIYSLKVKEDNIVNSNVTSQMEVLKNITFKQFKEVVLKFSNGNASKDQFEKQLRELVDTYKIVVFSKKYCGYSQAIRQLFELYKFESEPLFFDLDTETQNSKVQDQLGVLTERQTVPNVLSGASLKSRGGFTDFKQMHDTQTLELNFKNWCGQLVQRKEESNTSD